MFVKLKLIVTIFLHDHQVSIMCVLLIRGSNQNVIHLGHGDTGHVTTTTFTACSRVRYRFSITLNILDFAFILNQSTYSKIKDITEYGGYG
jgi:hypothetical protein